MPHDFPEIIFHSPANPDLEGVFSAKALEPFSDAILALLQDISASLLNNEEARKYPDVVSFAFWCRPASLRSLKSCHGSQSLRLGRGVLFHIAPSNVPVNFAYSLATGLLSGNANIVRLPSTEFTQVKIICSAFSELLETDKHRHLSNHVTLLRYAKNDKITDYLSAHCDIRIIWGGDQTINEIRRSSLPARSFDVTFADRYSFCCINADAYISETNFAKVASDFYNDTFLFDQNACTAPHLLVWFGGEENIGKAQEIFWSSLHTVVTEKYAIQAVSAVDKLVAAYEYIASHDGCQFRTNGDNLIVRLALNSLNPGIENSRCSCGYFYEFKTADINEVAHIINRKYQTMAYYGIDITTLRKFIQGNRLSGIDRIVPIGRTLDFSLTWDGYDLVAMLSRTVTVSG